MLSWNFPPGDGWEMKVGKDRYGRATIGFMAAIAVFALQAGAVGMPLR